MPQPSLPQEFLEPPLFFLFFALMWFGLGALYSILGGWASLAVQLRARVPVSGERFRFVSGSIGRSPLPVSYGGCLFVSVNEVGFGLSIMFLFRFLCPPLFIPWSNVESVELKSFLFVKRAVIRVRGQWPTISIRGKAGEYLAQAFERARSIR